MASKENNCSFLSELYLRLISGKVRLETDFLSEICMEKELYNENHYHRLKGVIEMTNH